ncbi:hypothetical protein [uncultured Cyclobacterium sp.]|uniref:hypothetical protein n=1 Tax=uncultured Cyclobacterium sp. TaxID=453820 RepID=UPI0030EB7694
MIDRIKVSENEKLLEALEGILNSTENDGRLALNAYPIEVLQMSVKDIENGDLISETDLRKEDSEWMD